MIVSGLSTTFVVCMSSRNPLCLAGLIFGTGSNACYVEKLKNVHTWDGDYDNPDEVRGRTFGWKNLRERLFCRLRGKRVLAVLSYFIKVNLSIRCKKKRMHHHYRCYESRLPFTSFPPLPSFYHPFPLCHHNDLRLFSSSRDHRT